MIDGEVVPGDDPVRVTMDDGLIRGDGVFEGMRFYARQPRTPDAAFAPAHHPDVGRDVARATRTYHPRRRARLGVG